MDIKKRNFIAGVIGNILDRYDMAIYGLMASFIAPNFFPSDDRVVSLIKAYGVMAIGIFTRPLGAFIFGRLAMTIGPKKVMVICLSGVAFFTGIIGLLPNYNSIGTSATYIFVLVRAIQGIFASGENAVAPFFVIQNYDESKTTRSSALYNFSTMIGVVIASLAATLVSYSSDPDYYWRYAFIFGFFTALAGIAIRVVVMSDRKEITPDLNFKKIVNLISSNSSPMLKVFFVGSFSYITYTIPFVFMNSFIPEVTDINISEMLQLNSVLLVLDTLLIPVFGMIAESYDRSKFMACMSGFVLVTVIPLFYFLEGSNFLYVMFVRLAIILAGLAYLAPLQAWFYNLFKGNERYLLVGIGYSFGEEILGRNSTAICLWLWYYFKSPVAPAFFIFAIAAAATWILINHSKEVEI